MSRGFKRSNEHAEAFGSRYAQIPKSVFAAIAYSFAMRLSEDNPDAAVVEFDHEWLTLHAAGIVPQAPIREPR